VTEVLVKVGDEIQAEDYYFSESLINEVLQSRGWPPIEEILVIR
jgi:hypothetical protein